MEQVLTVAQVARHFAHWRATRRGVSPLPQVLCDEVKELLKTHRCNEVLRPLGVSHAQAKEKGLFPANRPAEPNYDFTFVQVPTASVLSTAEQSPVLQSITTVTLTRGDTTLTLGYPTDAHIERMVKALLRT